MILGRFLRGKMTCHAFCFLAISGSFFASTAFAFQTYDELLANGIVGKPPDIGGYPVHVVYQWQAYGGSRIANKNYTGPAPYGYLSGRGYTDADGVYHFGVGYPDDVRVSQHHSDDFKLANRDSNGGYDGLISIDIEGWDFFELEADWPAAKSGGLSRPSKTMQSTMIKIREAIKAVREAFPKANISWYNLFVPGVPVSGFPDVKAEQITGMQVINNYYQPLLDAVDVLTPSMYYMSTKGDRKTPLSFDDYLVKLEMIVKEQKRLSKEKKIIPFVSPFIMDQYPDSSGSVGLIPLEEWKRLMDFLKTRVDGAIFWSKPNKNLTDWAVIKPYWELANKSLDIQQPSNLRIDAFKP